MTCRDRSATTDDDAVTERPGTAVQGTDTTSTLEHIAVSALRLIDTAEAASATLTRDGRISAAASVGELSVTVDDLQYALGEGPCIGCTDSMQVTRSNDTATDGQWPVFGPRAADAGIRSVLAIQYPVPRHTLHAAVAVFAREPGRFDEAAEQAMTVFAESTREVLADQIVADHLDAALSSRDLIGTAEGILMQRDHMSEEQAAETLTETALRCNVERAQVAVRIVEDSLLESVHTEPRDRAD